MKVKCPHCGRQVKLGKKNCPHCKAAMTYRKPVKKRVTWFIKFFAVLAVCVGVVLFAWYAVGNEIVLYFEGMGVVSDINAGDLSFTKTDSEAYNELPDYVKNMLPQKEEETDGPILQAMLPYIGAELESVDGLFGHSSVNYRIYAPDLAAWLSALDISAVSSTDQLLGMMLEYIPTAPLRQEVVTVNYYRDGILSFEGSYDTREFANAIYGGFNDAYSEFYERVMEEIKEAIGE